MIAKIENKWRFYGNRKQQASILRKWKATRFDFVKWNKHSKHYFELSLTSNIFLRKNKKNTQLFYENQKQHTLLLWNWKTTSHDFTKIKTTRRDFTKIKNISVNFTKIENNKPWFYENKKQQATILQNWKQRVVYEN